MSELLLRLREHGWRITPQRRVIVEALGGEHVHLTAEQVLARARERLPEVSLATVYNTLNELVELGELFEVAADDGVKRYDPNVREPHQHLVCVDCLEILDVRPSPLPKLPEAEQHGYTVLSTDVVFRGRCPRCAA